MATCRRPEPESAAFGYVPQTGDYADQLRKNLQQIKLPPGFKINLYAIVPDARHMAVGPQGVVTFVGTRKDTVWAVTDRNKDGMADEVKRFAPSLDFVIPNGVCFSKDGFLFVAERNRVRIFPAAEFFYESPDVAVGDVVKEGELIPGADESYNHTARVCAVGPDNKLYIQLGQPFNVPPPDKMDVFKKYGIGGIIRVDRDGTGPRGLCPRPAQPGRHRFQSGQPASCGRTTTRSTAWVTTFRRAS